MRCRSCSENIDSKYRYALANNVCPICGQKLLSDALFNLRIKVTHILETHEILSNKVDVISTDIMNTVIRSFVEEDRTASIQPTSEQKVELATSDKQLVKFGGSGKTGEPTQEDLTAMAEAEVGKEVREYGDDDPNNPENKEFLKEIGWDADATAGMKDAIKPRMNPIVKKIPNPISRLS